MSNYTNFPNGATSFGVPLPVAALLGPTQGNYYFVKPASGNDGNDGKSPASAFKTLAHALSVATAGQNDVIFLMAESNTASGTTDYQSATLAWNKDLVHLIGVNGGPLLGQRSRIAQLSTATGISPLFNLTANGCIIANIEIYQGVADATSLVAVQVTGQRNHFINCQLSGMGDATQVTTGAASLKISGGAENLFQHCYIGLDTITRDNTTQGELWLASAATRNQFEDCVFAGFISDAGYLHVTFTGATAIDRWTNFVRCTFLSESANDATAQTQIFGSMDSITQGYINLNNCAAFTPGATTAVWIDTGTNRLKVSAPSANKVGGAGVIVN